MPSHLLDRLRAGLVIRHGRFRDRERLGRRFHCVDLRHRLLFRIPADRARQRNTLYGRVIVLCPSFIFYLVTKTEAARSGNRKCIQK